MLKIEHIGKKIAAHHILQFLETIRFEELMKELMILWYSVIISDVVCYSG